MNNTKFIGGTLGTCISAFGISYSTTQVESIVSIICTILGLLITIVTTLIIPIAKKIKDANKDGKVTIEEVEDIVNTAKDGIDKLGGKE